MEACYSSYSMFRYCLPNLTLNTSVLLGAVISCVILQLKVLQREAPASLELSVPGSPVAAYDVDAMNLEMLSYCKSSERNHARSPLAGLHGSRGILGSLFGESKSIPLP